MAGDRLDDILSPEATAPFSAALTAVAMVIAALLTVAVFELDREPGGLTSAVIENLDDTGVEHPVTAVLLNIRSYDTWFELVVLLLGLIGVLAVRGGSDLPPASSLPRAGDLLVGLVRILVPAMVMVAGYLLWLGKYDAGGAFQAGVVLGVALVLLWYGGFPSAADLPAGVLRLGLASGVIGFLLVALTTIVGGDVMLELPPPYAGGVIVVIETLATVSIGLTVGCLVLGLQPERS